MLNNFIYAKTKDLFTALLDAGNVLDEAIVFIEDTKEIWNHGTYFGGSKVDLSNIETSILNILDNYATKEEIPNAVTESTVSGWGFTKNTGTYSKPSTGIPKSDLASAVQTSLGKADTALQKHQDISGKQDKLVSGTSIKTINGESVLGWGNLTITTEANIQAVTRLSYEEFEERPARDAIDLTTGEKVYFYGDAAYIGVSYTGGMLLDYIEDKISTIRIIKWDVEPTSSVEIPEGVSNWVHTQEGLLILNGGIAIIVSDNDLFYIQSCITKGGNIIITKVYSYQFTDREEILIESYPISSGGSGGSIAVDTSMSSTSTNPVQNKVIKSYIDSNCNIPIETTTAASKSLTANKYCKWTNTPTGIAITLATPSNTSILNNYMFEFTASSVGCTLSVPSTIKWINGTAPSIEAGKTYQISIINNLATVAKFS